VAGYKRQRPVRQWRDAILGGAANQNPPSVVRCPPSFSGQGLAWERLLVAYVAQTHPTGPDDAHPPEPVGKAFDFNAIFLPVISR
jgi:hypothetical protein